MRKIIILVSLFFTFNGLIEAQTAEIVAGPMLGYAEHTECLIWVQTKNTQHVEIQYKKTGSTLDWIKLRQESKPDQAGYSIHQFVLTGLEMNSSYSYQIKLNDQVLANFPYPLAFKTKKLWEHREPAPDFTFLLGSCFYVNDSLYDRPGKPYGQGTTILKAMTATPADFMLWLGDNTYTREADYSSESGIQYRYRHTRSEPLLQPFLAKLNHYAIWDDHDFGDNDGNGSFELKETSTTCFKKYWGNKNYGEDGSGIYSNFKFSDAEFFLLDDRTFRDESTLNQDKFSMKTQLGSKQMNWLKNKLKHSNSTFKFIAVGGQFLNDQTDFESFNLYRRERKELMQFLIDQKINGVVFLSGDRHHTELLRNDSIAKHLGYSLYDLTSSAISAGPSGILKTKEASNPMRVKNTLVVENNYCSIQVSGNEKGSRSILITCYDKNGIVKWGQRISEAELKAR